MGSEPASSRSHSNPFEHHGSSAAWKAAWHAGTSHHSHHPSAPTAGTPTTLASGLVGPLTFDVGPDGSVYVANIGGGSVSVIDLVAAGV